ncbi:unnamed protein product, partial [Prorocentrum cordatum]
QITINSSQYPRVATSADDALRLLHQWRQSWSRADELHTARPDFTLLYHGLRQMVGRLEKQYPEFCFRLATFVNTNSMSHSINVGKVLAFWEWLFGECRELVNGAASFRAADSALSTAFPSDSASAIDLDERIRAAVARVLRDGDFE